MEFYIESTQKSNFVNDITDSVLEAMNEYKFFSNSPIIKEISDKYKTISNLDFNNKHHVEYRKWKSDFTKQIKRNSNENYMSKVSDMPFGINNVVINFEFFPDKVGILKDNYDVGGFFNPTQDYITFIVNIASNISDKNEFIKDLKSSIVHEFIHVRQTYEAKLKNLMISIPRISVGNIEKKLDLMEKEFNEYLMHDLELEAYAIEYNYRHNNNHNKNDILAFAHRVFEKNIGSLTHKDNTTRQSLNNLFKRYVEKLSGCINKYRYTGF